MFDALKSSSGGPTGRHGRDHLKEGLLRATWADGQVLRALESGTAAAYRILACAHPGPQLSLLKKLRKVLRPPKLQDLLSLVSFTLLDNVIHDVKV